MADQKEGGSDQAKGLFILFCVFVALTWFLWYLFEFQIKDFFRWIRYTWMYLASFFTDDDFTAYWQGQAIQFAPWFKATPNIPPQSISNEVMGQISTIAMSPWKMLFTGIMVVMGLISMFNGPLTHNRRNLGLDGLIKIQSLAFPYITPFVKFNPANQPPRAPGSPVPAELPSFAEALGPEEWVAYNLVPVPDGKLDKEAAGRAFAKQLGKPWRGPMHLPPYKQVLLAAFCLKAARKRADSDKMLGDLACCWSKDNGLKLSMKIVSEARKVLRNRDMVGTTIAKCNQHAYENAAVLRGLATAREEGGVLAPSTFVWLRGHDRNLWYVLNNLGRQAYHIEGFGAMAHYKAEKMTQRPILRPKVEDAVNSLSDYMSSDRVRPIPPLDYSKSKNKKAIKKVKVTKATKA